MTGEVLQYFINSFSIRSCGLGAERKRGHHIEPKLIFFFWVKNKQVDGTSLGGPVWLGHHAFTAGAKVQSLVRELSPMQHCVVKNREKKKKNKQVEEKET